MFFRVLLDILRQKLLFYATYATGYVKLTETTKINQDAREIDT